ncbi:MAG: SHOCT domain-containing protein [Burkholderiales bacterium]|jgi:putative membrane protein|nr:SHOCT domain-containing protein [Burkholderiales bacterium]
MHYFGWEGGMGWGGLWMVLWWVLPVIAVAALVMWLGRADRRGLDKTALDILKERYARGEIDKAEFEQKRRDLEV